MTNYTDGQIEGVTLEQVRDGLVQLVKQCARTSVYEPIQEANCAKMASTLESWIAAIESILAERQAAKAGVHALWVSIDRMIVDAWKVGIEGKNLDMLAMVKRFNDAMLASVWPTAGGDSTMAGELEDCKKAYALLFAENAKIRSMADIIPGLVKALQDAVNNPNDDAYWIKQATDAIAAAEGEKK